MLDAYRTFCKNEVAEEMLDTVAENPTYICIVNMYIY